MTRHSPLPGADNGVWIHAAQDKVSLIFRLFPAFPRMRMKTVRGEGEEVGVGVGVVVVVVVRAG